MQLCINHTSNWEKKKKMNTLLEESKMMLMALCIRIDAR